MISKKKHLEIIIKKISPRIRRPDFVVVTVFRCCWVWVPIPDTLNNVSIVNRKKRNKENIPWARDTSGSRTPLLLLWWMDATAAVVAVLVLVLRSWSWFQSIVIVST